MSTVTFKDLQKYRLKKTVQRTLDVLGIEVRRVRPNASRHHSGGGLTAFGVQIRRRPTILDLRKTGHDEPTALVELLHHLEAGQTLLANISIRDCRQLWGWLAYDSAPITLTARALAEGEVAKAYAILAQFYNDFQPRTAAEAVGMETNAHPLIGYGPLAAPTPWGVLSPAAIEKVRTIDYLTDNMQDGQLNFSRRFGPASSDEVATEIQRLQKLIGSFHQSGYQRHNGADGDIRGQLLIDDRGGMTKSCVLLTGGGVHRAAVLAATGSPVLPVRINGDDFVVRSLAASWPQVVARVYSTDEALSIFDRMMAASPPPACRWIPHSADERAACLK